ncbi:MAG: hypothetical protein ABI151_05690, partial [Chitinophagaceae bacterium]
MKKSTICFACILIAATLCETVYGQANDYLKTLTWFREHNITLNDPTPPPGYRKFRDCDSNVVYKKTSGDTVTYYSLRIAVPRPLAYIKKILTKPYFNVTVYPKSLRPDGSVLMASLVYRCFLLRKDSLFAMDIAGKEIFNTYQKMQAVIDSAVNKQLNDPDDVSYKTITETTAKYEDSAELNNLEGIQALFRGGYHVNFQVIYYKNMFLHSDSIVLQRNRAIYSGDTSGFHLTVHVEKEWELGNRSCHLISFDDKYLFSSLTYFDNLVFASD